MTAYPESITGADFPAFAVEIDGQTPFFASVIPQAYHSIPNRSCPQRHTVPRSGCLHVYRCLVVSHHYRLYAASIYPQCFSAVYQWILATITVDIGVFYPFALTSAKERNVLNLEQTPEHPAVEHRILRLGEVEAKTGFKRAHLYTMMHKGQFPRTVRLGIRAVGWNSVEVEQWVRERLTHRV